ncbi:MAG: hypothetical protein LBK23_10290 [Oscillospiraceae bacterium]|nr:hypothetical protein [Oscillospiraceae bacterium]
MENKFTVTRAGRAFGEIDIAQNGLMTDMIFNGGSPDGENIYRLATICGGKYISLGVPVPAENGQFKLKKSFSKNALRELGITELSAFELVLPDELGKPAEQNAPPSVVAEAPPPAAAAQVITPPRAVLPEPEKSTPAPGLRGKNEAEDIGGRKPERRLTPEWTPEPEPERFFSDGGKSELTDAVRGALAREDGGVIYLAAPISEEEPFPMTPVFCFGTPETIGGKDHLVFKLKNGTLISP